MRRLSIDFDSSDLDISMIIKVVDEEKFAEEMEEINRFWCNQDERARDFGGHVNAGLRIFAAECFQQIAFNNFKDEDWLKDQFDWSKRGIEGFASLEDMGVEIEHIESWFVPCEHMDIKEI